MRHAARRAKTVARARANSNIALGLVHEHGAAAPAASVTMQHINAAMGRGEGASDLAVLIEVLEGMSQAVGAGA